MADPRTRWPTGPREQNNIEEAVQLADRILVLSSNPGRIRAELSVDMPRPRDRHDPRFDAAVLLGLAQVHKAQLEITKIGSDFASADIDTSKILFGEQAAGHAPLIKAIRRALRATSAADSPTRRPAVSSTSPATGAATASCSSTTPNAGN